MDDKIPAELLDRCWEIFSHYRKVWCFGKAQRLAVNKASMHAFKEGMVAAEAAKDKNPSTLGGLLDNHRLLIATMVPVALTATGSAVVTSASSDWVAPAVAWGASA